MFVIRYFDNPHSSSAREIGWTSAETMPKALSIAARRWPSLRESFGPDAGYVIESPVGQRVLVMPPR